MADAPDTVNSIVTRPAMRQDAPMKTTFKIALMCGVLASCGPVSMYYKPGASVSRLDTDTTNCQVAALRDAPVANEIRRSPPVYYPGPRICRPGGNCYYRPGYWDPGNIYTVDTNKPLRDKVTQQCMAARGYQQVNIQRCSEGVKQSAPAVQTTVMPHLTQSSCIIPYQSGQWQIVTPASGG